MACPSCPARSKKLDKRETSFARWLRSLVTLAVGLVPPLAILTPLVDAGVSDSSPPGTRVNLQPPNGSLIAAYYESFLRDHDLERFRQRVSLRYTEATLAGLIDAGSTQSRRAAVLALGLVGSYATNATVARALRDSDPVVRDLAYGALWAIWFRADTPENNESLRQIRTCNSRQQFEEAVELATHLILKTPKFAEAYNQRAIAYFLQGRFSESAADCQRTLELNPYHFGALGGLTQCQVELDQKREAIQSLRRALRLQPYEKGIRDSLRLLEAEN